MRVDAKDISVTLAGRQVLSGLDVSLRPGAVTGLLGPNGSGKSTLIRVLAGHCNHTGRVTVDSTDVHALASAERARLIGWLPQDRTVSWPLSVANVIALGRMPWHSWRQSLSYRDRDICTAAAHLLGVDQLAERRVTELSGGEVARVLLARVVAQDTRVLLADEPASGLDPAHQIRMIRALRALAARGRTVLVSLHDLSLAARWCHRIILLSEGRLAAEGAPADVLVPEKLSAVYGISVKTGRDRGGPWLAPLDLSKEKEI